MPSDDSGGGFLEMAIIADSFAHRSRSHTIMEVLKDEGL